MTATVTLPPLIDPARCGRSLLGRGPWIYKPRDDVASLALARDLGVSPILAQILLHRGVGGAAAAEGYLSPRLVGLHEPACFREMEAAVERVRRAIERRERVLIYGDYDVDGTAAAGLLCRVLRLVGADVRCFVPERLSDGYGLKASRLVEFHQGGVSLVICVDNGTTAFEALAEARRLGLDVIVTDHHEPAADGRLPDAFALLNPKVVGETYPDRGLAGVGVAFKLAWGVAKALAPDGRSGRTRADVRDALTDALALVAIGTVADAVPLVGENRVLVAHGLRALAQARQRGATRFPGLLALLDAARVEGRPSPDDLAFRVAPRLNAAGRMGEARLALELLETDAVDRAREIAAALDAANRRRQELERRVAREAIQRAETGGGGVDGTNALVLADAGWPLGVIGIVASRLVERFGRPSVLIALDGERGRGSARSVPGIALHRALARCGDELVRFGGHAGAAGLEIRADRIDAFRERLQDAVAAVALEAETPAPAALARGEGQPVDVDLGVPFSALTPGLVRELERLEPCGRGNDPPTLATRSVVLVAPPRPVGAGSRHLTLLLRHGRQVVRAIGFGMGDLAGPLAGHVRRAALGPEASGTGPGGAGAGRGPLAVAYRPIPERGEPNAFALELRDVRVDNDVIGRSSSERSEEAPHGPIGQAPTSEADS